MVDIMDGMMMLGLPKEELVFDGDIGKDSEKLKEALKVYTSKNESLHVGEVVRWKIGMRNRSLPYGQPMIVVGFSPEIINPIDDPFTPYFKERLDTIVGTWATNGDFIMYYVDGNRLELHDGTIKPEELALKKDDEKPKVKKGALSEEEINELLNKFDRNHGDVHGDQ